MESDHWVVGMKPDDPLVAKEYITKEDILDKPLILPKRPNVQNELANWFGKDFNNSNCMEKEYPIFIGNE